MTRRKPYMDTISIYGVYNKQDEIVFIGTRDEILKEFQIKQTTYFYRLIKNDIYYKYKYKIRYLYDEKLEELTCRQCGETKPIDMFKIRSKERGHEKICKECFNAHIKSWNIKRNGGV